MRYVPLPVVIVSASGVGAMDLARIGAALVDIGSSKTAAPCRADLIEVSKDNSPDLAAQSRRAVVFKLELSRSQELATYLLDTKAEALSRKNGLIIDLPVHTRCEEIQRLRFTGSRLFPDEFTGVQVRVTDGPNKGFEGWVFTSWVTTAR